MQEALLKNGEEIKMGAWGTSLYENDTTCDIRDDYIDKLKRGKNSEEATNELICQNREIVGDIEEEPLFWYALADTQWEYGRLLPEVKEKALFFIEQKKELERWKESGKEKYTAWRETLTALKEKLNVPAPEPKRFQSTVYTVARGSLAMYLPINSAGITAKKRASITNMLYSGKFRRIPTGLAISYRSCRYITGSARSFHRWTK